jgi:hypothetical protein
MYSSSRKYRSLAFFAPVNRLVLDLEIACFLVPIIALSNFKLHPSHVLGPPERLRG